VIFDQGFLPLALDMPVSNCRALGIRGLMGEKGLIEEDWKDRDEWKKKIR